MEHFVWLMDQLRMLAEWRSASMECGEQCVIALIMAGIVMMLESCADNWGTMSTQVEVGYFVLLLFKSACRPFKDCVHLQTYSRIAYFAVSKQPAMVCQLHKPCCHACFT